MIAEKVWAKVTGSYSNAESGAPSWAWSHLSNDPTDQLSSRYMSGSHLWNKIKTFSDREYLMTAGT